MDLAALLAGRARLSVGSDAPSACHPVICSPCSSHRGLPYWSLAGKPAPINCPPPSSHRIWTHPIYPHSPPRPPPLHRSALLCCAASCCVARLDVAPSSESLVALVLRVLPVCCTDVQRHMLGLMPEITQEEDHEVQ